MEQRSLSMAAVETIFLRIGSHPAKRWPLRLNQQVQID